MTWKDKLLSRPQLITVEELQVGDLVGFNSHDDSDTAKLQYVGIFNHIQNNTKVYCNFYKYEYIMEIRNLEVAKVKNHINIDKFHNNLTYLDNDFKPILLRRGKKEYIDFTKLYNK